MSDDQDEPYSLKIPYFNRKTRDVPCFKDSFMYGIGGGFGAGLVFFLATSKVKRSCDIAVAAFTGVTLGYWMHCRYQWSKQRFYYRQLRADLEDYVTKEGTNNGPVDV